MAISDAAALGCAISKHAGNLKAALQEYQKERVPQTAKEVCLSLKIKTSANAYRYHGLLFCVQVNPLPVSLSIAFAPAPVWPE